MFDTFEGYPDRRYFQPRSGHGFVEIYVHQADPLDIEFIEGSIAEDEIGDWLRETDAKIRDISEEHNEHKTSTLRLLISAPRRDPGLRTEPFPFSRSTYIDTVEAFRFPEPFLGLVASHTSIATEFQSNEHTSGVLANLSSHGIVLSHDSYTRTTNCFIVGLCQHQIDRCKRELRAMQHFAADPMLIASIWLDVFIETRARRSEGRRIGMRDIQLEAGTHWSIDANKFDPMALDFDGLTQKLTVLWSELAWDEFALNLLTSFQARIVQVHAAYRITENSLSEVAWPNEALSKRLTSSKDLLHGLQVSTTMSTQLANIQLQTMYSFISQRDNHLNIAQAEASRQLAELSLHDSSVMRSVAIDSRKVALLTRRDSTDMRIIAAVTLAFLPGTFTATLFSTSFFSFGPKDDHQVVSSWIWLYWVVAIVLTVIVMIGWYTFSRRTNQDLQRSIDLALPDAPQPTPAQAMNGSTRERRSSMLPLLDLDRLQTSRLQDLHKIRPVPNSSSLQLPHARSAVRSRARDFEEVLNPTAPPLKPARPLPSSKVGNMGVKDDTDTCPCCARPLR